MLSGNATVTESPDQFMRYSLSVKISAQNTSKKEILLIVLEIEAKSDIFNVHGVTSQDYFFRPDSLIPLSTESIEFLSQRAVQSSEIYKSSKPFSVFTNVAFVQFVDGSTWGDIEIANESLRVRRVTSEKLEHLSAVYRIAGKKEFIEELMKPSDLPVIATLQQACSVEGKDGDTVASMVQDMLHRARSRAIPNTNQRTS